MSEDEMKKWLYQKASEINAVRSANGKYDSCLFLDNVSVSKTKPMLVVVGLSVGLDCGMEEMVFVYSLEAGKAKLILNPDLKDANDVTAGPMEGLGVAFLQSGSDIYFLCLQNTSSCTGAFVIERYKVFDFNVRSKSLALCKKKYWTYYLSDDSALPYVLETKGQFIYLQYREFVSLDKGNSDPHVEKFQVKRGKLLASRCLDCQTFSDKIPSR
jgi:hypothetical protein